MPTSHSSRSSLLRSSLAALVVSAGALAGAQTPAVPSDSAATKPVQPLSFQTAAVPLFTAGSGLSQAGFSSSNDSYDPKSAAQTQMASLGKSFALPGAEPMQYGQRRRYGAPRYRGGNTNADGSEKYEGYAGVGFDASVGTNSNYLTPSYAFQVGAGRNFNRHLGLNIEFDYDHFGLSNDALLYYSNLFGDSTNSYGFGGNNHIWSFNLQPVYQIYSGPGLGAYITGGVGFYHKVTNFTLPSTQYGCSYYYCGYYSANANVDHYTSNAPGFDGGIGLTYKFSRFSNERLYAEARYVYVDNSYRPGITAANYATYTGSNLFPQNSNTTSYFPIKFGLRF